MNEIETQRYDYLRRKRYLVHEEHEQFIRPETLAEMREYEAVPLQMKRFFLKLIPSPRT